MPHSSILFTIGSVIPICVAAMPPHFSHVAYLPLSHIFELAIHIGVLSLGGNIGYADPRTLTDAGARPTGALEEFKPHLIMGVPKVYEVIMKGALAEIAKLPAGKQQLVNAAFEWKLAALNAGRYTPVFDKLIFKKIEDMLGGRVNGILSGGGPLASHIQDWIRTAFGCYVVQGYALTETCAGASFSLLGDTRPFNVGPPIPGVEIMLRSCLNDEKGEPEILDRNGLPYLSKDRVDAEGNPCLGRGEVMIRGPTVSYGYFRLPEKTKESFLPNGWFRTGDVGLWCPDGTLRIIDRIKNLVKLKGGEYIALENMEMVYSGSQYVDALAGGLMVYGDGTMDRPVAIVQVREKAITQWAKDNDIEYKNIQDLLENSAVNKEVMRSLLDCYITGHLMPIEKLSAIGLIADPWTCDNKCLTATNKISRHGVAKRDGEMLESLKPLGR
ncbi:Long-chain-fatty-acid--CoA ligase 3, partial [Perkinsus olseni]